MKINLLDGGILFELNKKYSDYGEYAIFNDKSLIKQLYQDYINIGCTYITTSNYGFTPLKLSNWKQATIESINLLKEFKNKGIYVCGCVPPYFKSYSYEPVTKNFEIFYRELIPLMIGNVDYLLLETVVSIQHAQTIIQIIKELDNEIPIMLSLYINDFNKNNINKFFKLPIERLMVNCCSFSDLALFYHQYLDSQSWQNIKFGFYCNKINEKSYSNDCQICNLQKFKNQDEISENNLNRFLKELPFNEIIIGGCCGYGVSEMKKLKTITKNVMSI